MWEILNFPNGNFFNRLKPALHIKLIAKNLVFNFFEKKIKIFHVGNFLNLNID